MSIGKTFNDIKPFITLGSDTPEIWLCAYFQYESSFLFLSHGERSNFSFLTPFILSFKETPSAEESVSEINEFFFQKLEISPQDIIISYETLSLQPLLNKNIVQALVKISEKDFNIIAKNDRIVSVNLSTITRHTSTNFFFNNLIKTIL